MKLCRALVIFGVIAASLVSPRETVEAQSASAPASVSDKRDGQHDFDFLVGTWKFHLKRLKKRFAGSTEWLDLDGTTVCRKILDGRAEVEDMNVESADKQMHIQGLAMRLYNPESHQWSIYWVNGADGILEQNPMVGQFTNGRGEFYNQQIFEAEPSMPDTSGQAHNRYTALRAGIFYRWRENMGNQLDHRPNQTEAVNS